MREYTPKERRDKIEIEKGNYACASCGRTKHPLIDHPFCAQVCSKCTVGGTPHPHLTQADIMARNDVIDYLPEPTKAEKIERDILDELSTLRQKVADLETAKVFQVQIFDNIIERLNDVEDKLRHMDRILGGFDLQRL